MRRIIAFPFLAFLQCRSSRAVLYEKVAFLGDNLKLAVLALDFELRGSRIRGQDEDVSRMHGHRALCIHNKQPSMVETHRIRVHQNQCALIKPYCGTKKSDARMAAIRLHNIIWEYGRGSHGEFLAIYDSGIAIKHHSFGSAGKEGNGRHNQTHQKNRSWQTFHREASKHTFSGERVTVKVFDGSAVILLVLA